MVDDKANQKSQHGDRKFFSIRSRVARDNPYFTCILRPLEQVRAKPDLLKEV